MGGEAKAASREGEREDGERWVTRTFRLEFTTPAFLGDAGQAGAWRTPPFKHLLREWWRVVYADQSRYRVEIEAMRRAESALFGAAADGESAQSLVRLRLSRWDEGGLQTWAEDPQVYHPEVGERGRKIGAHLYLGYGPLNYSKDKKGTFLGRKEGKDFVAKRAIDAGEEARLMLAFPAAHAATLDRVLWLIDHYGAIGGRARNGWGSLTLAPEEGTRPVGTRVPLRPWRDCLDREWAHAIGTDAQGPLIWMTKPFGDWRELMRRLAEIKIGLRTRFPFRSGKAARQPDPRHWLAYPVTNHDVRSWSRLRLPNSLRFKVRKGESGKPYGVIFHMPCLPPANFSPDRGVIERVWREVHAFLDGHRSLKRGAA